MKKRVVTLSLASLLVGPAFTHVQRINATVEEDTIILESPILHAFDGTSIGIDASVIHAIGLIRRDINRILIGDKAEDGSMVGRYLINGQHYSVKDLIPMEKNAPESLQKELACCLHEAKKDLHNYVKPFISTINSVKYQLLELIKESCKKRGIDTTLLLRWSEAAQGEEERIFNEDVTSFTLYNRFCTDLLNFLMDLVNSCPKARAQYKLLCDKVQKARTITKEIILKRGVTPAASSALEQKFMHHLKENHLDKIAMTDITKEKLEALFVKFTNQKN